MKLRVKSVLSVSDILYLSVSCSLPVCPCSAAVPRHFHICGGGSSCRLCSAGHASPCFQPRTPHVWLLYLTDTHRKEATGSDLSCHMSNCVPKRAAKWHTGKKQRKWEMLDKTCKIICGASVISTVSEFCLSAAHPLNKTLLRVAGINDD